MFRGAVSVSALVLTLAAPASAATITYVDLGTGAPPGTLGDQAMTPFGLDGRPEFTDVNSVSSPLGGSLGFSTPLELDRIGSGWGSWSHGYTGDVYFDSQTSLTMALPDFTTAFYFYAEPNILLNFDFTVIASDGTTAMQSISGFGGATGFGFYTSDGSSISSITIHETDPTGFAIGEFGIASSTAAVPEPATLLLLGTGITGLLARYRRRK